MTVFAKWFMALFGFETREMRYVRMYALSRQMMQNRID
jgi:hypothetical protein